MDTIWGLVAVYFVVSVPIATGAVKQVFGELDPMYEDVGLTLDLSRWGVFMKVIVPMTYRELLSSFMIAWNRVVSEFGSIVVLTYYVVNSPLFNYVYPLPVLIWYTYEVYGLPMALGYASVSFIISIVMLVLVEIIGGEGFRLKP